MRIRGLSANWDAGVYDLNGRRLLKRMAIHEGTGYFVLDVSRPWRFLAGNLVTASNPSAVVNLLALSQDGGEVLVHNPTDGEMAVIVRTQPDLTAVPVLHRQLTLGPGAEVTVIWP